MLPWLPQAQRRNRKIEKHNSTSTLNSALLRRKKNSTAAAAGCATFNPVLFLRNHTSELSL